MLQRKRQNLRKQYRQGPDKSVSWQATAPLGDVKVCPSNSPPLEDEDQTLADAFNMRERLGTRWRKACRASASPYVVAALHAAYQAAKRNHQLRLNDPRNAEDADAFRSRKRGLDREGYQRRSREKISAGQAARKSEPEPAGARSREVPDLLDASTSQLEDRQRFEVWEMREVRDT